MHVLVTGFAGTLGSAFTQYFLHEGHQVTGVDNNEWAVAAYPESTNLEVKLADFSAIKGTYDLVIHCAAFKHVDLIEKNPASAWSNNVNKTERLMRNVKTDSFLFVSTDKSVEPASVYGRQKHIAEQIVHKRGGIVARLGNIRASSGSVIPKWEGCIIRGEPLPITDPNMTRYMIDVDDAVVKIMELWKHAMPGQVIVPEMGEPIKLMDIVEQVLDRYGYMITDGVTYSAYAPGVSIVGLRPGEKMHEKLTWNSEKPVYASTFGAIYQAKTGTEYQRSTK